MLAFFLHFSYTFNLKIKTFNNILKTVLCNVSALDAPDQYGGATVCCVWIIQKEK